MPSWDAHRSITLAALSMLGSDILSGELVRHLLEGVVDPDRVPDKESRLRLSKRGSITTSVNYARHHKHQRDLIEYYFNLALHYYRKGDQRKSMLMLGRALHYVQDSSLSRKRLLVIDVHDAEEDKMNKLAYTYRSVLDLCRDVVVGGRDTSTRGDEAVCIALERTRSILKRFSEEIVKTVNVQALKKKVAMIRLAKVSLALALILLALTNPFNLVLTSVVFIACIIAYTYKPMTYYEAMRAGLMIVKPVGYEPAYV